MSNTCDLWNKLSQQIKDSDTFLKFKNNLQQQYIVGDSDNSFFFNYGSRNVNILHCKLRNRSSALNYDLFYSHLVPSRACECGFPCEDVNHYLFHCPNYQNQKIMLLHELSWYNNITAEKLLFGDVFLNKEFNAETVPNC